MGPDISSFEMPEMFGFNESTEDFFEAGGRVATYKVHPMNRGLLPEHSLEITGLGFQCENYPDGTDLILEYRVDADDMDPQRGTVAKQIPTGLGWILQDPEKYGLPKDITLEQLEDRTNSQEGD